MKEEGIKLYSPFGPVFCEFKLSEKTVSGLNKFVDELEKDSKLRKKLDAGPHLAGQVSEEITIPMEVSKEGLGPELSRAIATYVESTCKRKLTKLKFLSFWIVRPSDGLKRTVFLGESISD